MLRIDSLHSNVFLQDDVNEYMMLLIVDSTGATYFIINLRYSSLKHDGQLGQAYRAFAINSGVKQGHLLDAEFALWNHRTLRAIVEVRRREGAVTLSCLHGDPISLVEIFPNMEKNDPFVPVARKVRTSCLEILHFTWQLDVFSTLDSLDFFAGN